MMERFIEIDGQKVPVTEEVYQEYKRPVWRERKRSQRMEEKNTGEAIDQTTIVGAKPLSIEQMLEEGVDIPYYGPTVEQIVMLKMLMEELHRALEQLTQVDRTIMEMVGSGATEREICRITGLPKTTVRRRKDSLIRKLKDEIVNNL